MNNLLIIIVLLSCILVHEFGHFLIAKVLEYEVEEFSVGVGPKIISKKWHNTVYSLRLIPLGGYVRFDEEELVKQSGWKHMFVSLAGSSMNFISVIVCVFIINCIGNDGTYSLFEILKFSFFTFGQLTEQFIIAFWELISSGFGNFLGAASGPIGIVAESGQMMTSGDLTISSLIIMLNLNLGVLNLLPIPILDGFNVIVEFIRWVTKKRMEKPVYYMQAAGAIMLMTLIIVIIGNDLIKLFA